MVIMGDIVKIYVKILGKILTDIMFAPFMALKVWSVRK